MHFADATDMRNDSKGITYPAIATALSVVLIFVSEILPSGQLGVVACASVISLIIAQRFGIMSAVYIYAATSILSFLLIPSKTAVFLYILFFGFYPVIKILFDKLPKALSWVLKLITVNISLLLIYKVLSAAVLSYSIFKKYVLLYFLIGSIVFIVFDIGVGQICSYINMRFKK